MTLTIHPPGTPFPPGHPFAGNTIHIGQRPPPDWKPGMNPDEAQELQKIEAATHEDLARIWRFAPSTHPWINNRNLWVRFNDRFAQLGGMTTEMSKRIGWE